MHDLLRAPNSAAVVVTASTNSPSIDRLTNFSKASTKVSLGPNKDVKGLKTPYVTYLMNISPSSMLSKSGTQCRPRAGRPAGGRERGPNWTRFSQVGKVEEKVLAGQKL